MTFVTAMRLIVLAAIAAFGGGFAWGVADHRGIAAVADFADHHIVFPKPDREALLVFACDSSQPLVAYNLLNDEVLTKQQEIKARLASPVNLVFQNNLFSHYTAFGAGVFGTMFSLTDELRRWKARESTKWTIALLGAVVIPTSYLGYLASDWFRLECGSKSIYERLADKRLWGPHRLDAARAMFDQLAYCIDRRVTLPGEQESSASFAPDAPGGGESPRISAAVRAGARRGGKRRSTSGEPTFPRRTRTCRSNRPSRVAIASRGWCPAGRNRKRNRRGETASTNASMATRGSSPPMRISTRPIFN
jgi:hypothetical protein